MILIYTTDKNHPRKVIETCQVNSLLCNDLLRHFNMLLRGSAPALAPRVPGRSALSRTPAGDGEGAARAWLPAALQDFACHYYLPFLPSTAPLERKEENQTQSLYHRHLSPVGPKYPRFWLSGGPCPRASLAGSLAALHWALLSCLPNLPFPHSSKPPWPHWGAWSPPWDSHLPPVSSSWPQSQGHTAGRKPDRLAVSWVKPGGGYPSTISCWKVDSVPITGGGGQPLFLLRRRNSRGGGASPRSRFAVPRTPASAFCWRVVGRSPAGQQWGDGCWSCHRAATPSAGHGQFLSAPWVFSIQFPAITIALPC